MRNGHVIGFASVVAVIVVAWAVGSCRDPRAGEPAEPALPRETPSAEPSAGSGPSGTADEAPTVQPGTVHWVDSAATVEELSRSAAVIVRARCRSQEGRSLSEDLPVYAEDGTTVLEMRRVTTRFTESTFEVVETWKGSPGPSLVVLQTGGPAPNGGLQADPLFETGSEHVLFLQEVTGDGVHSQGRELYRVVNGLARYEVVAGGALRPPPATAGSEAAAPSLDGLERQVRDAL